MSGRIVLGAMCLLVSATEADELRFTDITLQAGTGGPTERGRLYGTFSNASLCLTEPKGMRVMKSLFFIVCSFSRIIAPE